MKIETMPGHYVEAPRLSTNDLIEIHRRCEGDRINRHIQRKRARRSTLKAWMKRLGDL